jgi:hypothetical protein
MGMCGGRSGGLRCAQAWDKNNVATASNCSEAFIGFSELPKSFLASFGYTSRIMAPWKLTLLKSPGVRAGIGVGTAAFMLGADSAKNLGPCPASSILSGQRQLDFPMLFERYQQ